MDKQAMKYVNVMQINTTTTESEGMRLARGQHEVIVSGRDKRLTCTSGLLWVTLENDRFDHILAEHQSLSLTGRRKVVLSGLRPSSYILA